MRTYPSDPIRLAISSSPEHLPIVRAALGRLAGMLGFDERAAGELVLAVDEALTNIIRHAYHDRADEAIEVTFVPDCRDDDTVELRVELRDWGEHAPPAEVRSRALGDVRPGGLGVHIMKRCMDKVEYAAAPGGGTHLTMIKILKARSAQ